MYKLRLDSSEIAIVTFLYILLNQINIIFTLKSMHNINPITLKSMYHHTYSYIKSKINIYTKVNAYSVRNQI